MVLHADKGGPTPGADSPAASPGFTWGRSGQVNTGAYLQNDTVPSNLAGRLVHVDDGVIAEAWIVVEDTASGVTIAFEKRVGAVFTELCTISLLAGERIKTESFNILVDRLDEIACRVKTGAAKNIDCGILIKGDTG